MMFKIWHGQKLFEIAFISYQSLPSFKTNNNNKKYKVLIKVNQ